MAVKPKLYLVYDGVGKGLIPTTSNTTLTAKEALESTTYRARTVSQMVVFYNTTY